MYVGGVLNWGYPLESWLIKGLIPYIPTVVSSLRCHRHFVSRGNPINSIFRLGKYHPSLLGIYGHEPMNQGLPLRDVRKYAINPTSYFRPLRMSSNVSNCKCLYSSIYGSSSKCLTRCSNLPVCAGRTAGYS